MCQGVNNFLDKEYGAILEVYSDAIIHFSEGNDRKVIYNLDSLRNADMIVGKANDLMELKG